MQFDKWIRGRLLLVICREMDAWADFSATIDVSASKKRVGLISFFFFDLCRWSIDGFALRKGPLVSHSVNLNYLAPSLVSTNIEEEKKIADLSNAAAAKGFFQLNKRCHTEPATRAKNSRRRIPRKEEEFLCERKLPNTIL